MQADPYVADTEDLTQTFRTLVPFQSRRSRHKNQKISNPHWACFRRVRDADEPATLLYPSLLSGIHRFSAKFRKGGFQSLKSAKTIRLRFQQLTKIGRVAKLSLTVAWGQPTSLRLQAERRSPIMPPIIIILP